jgi:uncharacterized phage protein (TIGR02216 family)
MGLAFGQLRLTPKQFWRITPRELQAALDGFYGGVFGGEAIPVMGRRDFDALCAQFPDQGINHAPN